MHRAFAMAFAISLIAMSSHALGFLVSGTKKIRASDSKVQIVYAGNKISGVRLAFLGSNSGYIPVCVRQDNFKEQHTCTLRMSGQIVRIVVPRIIRALPIAVHIFSTSKETWSGYVSSQLLLPIIPIGTKLKLQSISGVITFFASPSSSDEVQIGFLPGPLSAVSVGSNVSAERVQVHLNDSYVPQGGWVSRLDARYLDGEPVNAWKL